MSARITSEGLLGNQQYLHRARWSMDYLKAGGEIENTQGAIDLMGV